MLAASSYDKEIAQSRKRLNKECEWKGRWWSEYFPSTQEVAGDGVENKIFFKEKENIMVSHFCFEGRTKSLKF